MAHVRVMLAGALLAACGQAGAAADELKSGLTAPAGWQPAPAIATAASAALTNPDAVEGAEGWAEPAMGCYAVWLAYRGDGVPDAIAERIVAGLGEQGITAREVSAPAAGSGSAATGTLALAFERAAGSAGSGAAAIDGLPAAYAGSLRARLGGGRIELVACFASERERPACAAACTTFLGGFP